MDLFNSLSNKSTSNNSIVNQIDFGKTEALNVQGNFSLRESFGCGGSIKSNEGDPEILLHIIFKQKISIVGICIESNDNSLAPKQIQMFSGKSNIDFSDIGSVNPTEILDFIDGKTIPLKKAKYKNIDGLSVFLSNEDAKYLKINNIILLGEEGETTDMSQMKNTNP